MAQIIEKPILSICIPIYNRLSYLERMLERFYEEKELFDSKIELFISDNCSEDDLQSCCNRFSKMGLRLKYHRNDTNLGMDGNFINCFNSAEGDYVWLLGSDDIPKKGYIEKIYDIILNSHKRYGVLHLAGENPKQNEPLFEFEDCNGLLEELNVWITFISGIVVNKVFVNDVDFDKYRGTLISQVPLYIKAIISSPVNAVLYAKVFEEMDDSANNGGYNIFQVFVANLYCIYQSFFDNGLVKKNSIDIIKEREFKEFLLEYVVTFLILHKKSNFETKNAWRILAKYYRTKPYAYYCPIKRLLGLFLRWARSKMCEKDLSCQLFS